MKITSDKEYDYDLGWQTVTQDTAYVQGRGLMEIISDEELLRIGKIVDQYQDIKRTQINADICVITEKIYIGESITPELFIYKQTGIVMSKYNLQHEKYGRLYNNSKKSDKYCIRFHDKLVYRLKRKLEKDNA